MNPTAPGRFVLTTPALAPEPLAFAVLSPRSVPAAAEERESEPKKKRSYSVDRRLCEDLELLSWYQGRSSSSVVEELLRQHLQQNRALVAKAREIRNAR